MCKIKKKEEVKKRNKLACSELIHSELTCSELACSELACSELAHSEVRCRVTHKITCSESSEFALSKLCNELRLIKKIIFQS